MLFETDLQKISDCWKTILSEEINKPYYKALLLFVEKEYQQKTVYPPLEKVYSWMHLCPFSKIKLVILGQDPYHQPKQATGLAFSVSPGTSLPPSLRNIFKELFSDLGIQPPSCGSLDPWAREGILLLNSVLTVRRGEAGSHQGRGWEQLTEKIVQSISKRKNGIVFMLWGKSAGEKERLIDKRRHLVLKAAHPSPLSARRGFFGCRHFSQANGYLKEQVNWDLSVQSG